MDGDNLQDFVLALEKSEAGFRAHVVDSPAGQADGTFVLPFSETDLTALYAQFGRTPAPGSMSSSVTAQTFGKALFDAVFVPDLYRLFARSREIARGQNAGLRLVLRLSNAPVLQDLPWELLSAEDGFLALSTETPIVRYLELAQPPRAVAVQPPVRALVVISNPNDYPPLDVEKEWSRLQDALSEVVENGLFQLVRLARADLNELQTQLSKDQYHILHFIGHGSFDESSQTPALQWTNADGSGQSVSAEQLTMLLRDHRQLRLVVLNACETARASTRSAFAGIAQTLIKQALPAVIAMQFAVSDQAAQVFARVFYSTIANGSSLDRALSEARKAIYINHLANEWATPVLYTRARDEKIFDLGKLEEPERLQLRLGALLRRGKEALAAEQFTPALLAVQNMLALDPTNAAARDLQNKVSLQRDVYTAYMEGKKFSEQGQWSQALAAFRRVQKTNLDYRDTNDLADRAQAQLPTRSDSAPDYDPLESHYENVAEAFMEGEVVPFLGAGVNLMERPEGLSWKQGEFLPNGRELAEYLADHFKYKEAEERQDLNRVSQYVAVEQGLGPLYRELHWVFNGDYPPTQLHHFLARVPAILREKGVKDKYPIIVTANYDDLLERAFQKANEPYDLMWYVADGKDDLRRKFIHRAPDGTQQPIREPDDYRGIHPDRQTVIIKLHGAVDRTPAERDSYVITEDHYLDYLTNSNILDLAPTTLRPRLMNSHFLFMGYSLRDWNLRVLLYRIWGAQALDYNSWAIQRQPQRMDITTWGRRNVEIKDKLLTEYIAGLERQLRQADARGLKR